METQKTNIMSYENTKHDIMSLLTPESNTEDMCELQKEFYYSILKSIPQWREGFYGKIPYDFDHLPTNYKLLFAINGNKIDILHSTCNPYDKQNLKIILTISFENNKIVYSQKQYYRKISLDKNIYCTICYDKRQKDISYKNDNIVICTDNDDVHILIYQHIKNEK